LWQLKDHGQDEQPYAFARHFINSVGKLAGDAPMTNETGPDHDAIAAELETGNYATVRQVVNDYLHATDEKVASKQWTEADARENKVALVRHLSARRRDQRKEQAEIYLAAIAHLQEAPAATRATGIGSNFRLG
jgi:hypothetical protein